MVWINATDIYNNSLVRELICYSSSKCPWRLKEPKENIFKIINEMSFGVGSSYIHIQHHDYRVESSKPRPLGLDNSMVPLEKISRTHVSQLACPWESQGFLELTAHVESKKRETKSGPIRRAKTGKALTYLFSKKKGKTLWFDFGEKRRSRKRFSTFKVLLEMASSV